MTWEEAVQQLKAEIESKGKFSIGNAIDALLGVVVANKSELQKKLNDLMQRKGILTAEDEKAVQELLAKQEAERKERKKKRIEKAVLTVSAFLGTGVLIYFTFKKKGK